MRTLMEPLVEELFGSLSFLAPSTPLFFFFFFKANQLKFNILKEQFQILLWSFLPLFFLAPPLLSSGTPSLFIPSLFHCIAQGKNKLGIKQMQDTVQQRAQPNSNKASLFSLLAKKQALHFDWHMAAQKSQPG